MGRFTVSVGDVELAVTESGSGPPVVLIHGFPELAFSWRRQLPALEAAGYRAVAYDQRGYGGSSCPPEIPAYRLAALVGDLIGLCDVLELRRPVIVGHDWGSTVAWTAALTAPDRVAALASLNVPYRGYCAGFPPLGVVRERYADRFAYVLAFQEPGAVEAAFAADPEGWLRGFYAFGAGRDGFMTEDEFGVYLDAFRRTGVAGAVSYYRNLDANWDDTAEMAGRAVRQPALMIAADRDPVLPVSLIEGMERWVPDLRTVVVAGCGHWTQQERPAEVNRLLLEFLGEVAPVAG